MNTPDWLGITYPRFLQNKFIWWLWKRLLCPHGWHLWDEVLSTDHTLYCDACELDLRIEAIK